MAALPKPLAVFPAADWRTSLMQQLSQERAARRDAEARLADVERELRELRNRAGAAESSRSTASAGSAQQRTDEAAGHSTQVMTPRSAPPAMLDATTVTELQRLAGGDSDFLRDLLEQYEHDSLTRLGELDAAAAAGDSERLVRLAHALRGSSANVGAVDVAEACRGVERLAQVGAVSCYADAVAAVHAAYARVLPALAALRQ